MTEHRIGITVAISTRGRPDALARCLDALWAGRLRPDETVVVDQSDDERTREDAERRRADGMPLVYVRNHSCGLGASQNAAFVRASHPVVAVTDDDCVPDERWLATIASWFATHPELDGVTGRVLPLPARGDRRFPVSSRTSMVPREFVSAALPWEVGSGNNFALRRATYARIGGCDVRLGPGSPAQGGVDMDLFHRLIRSGARIRYDPELVVHHERQTRAERSARRSMYGRGMGTAIALWRRAGDRSALGILGQWVLLRIARMRLAAGRGDWRDVRDEIVMLGATSRGLLSGWRLANAPGPARDVTGVEPVSATRDRGDGG